MIYLLLFLAALAATWLIFNIAGWVSIRFWKIEPSQPPLPFNWRILLGHRKYLDWAWPRSDHV